MINNCGVCGGRAEHYFGPTYNYIQCRDCGRELRVLNAALKSQREVVDEWNTKNPERQSAGGGVDFEVNGSFI